MATDRFGGIIQEQPKTDRFGGIIGQPPIMAPPEPGPQGPRGTYTPEQMRQYGTIRGETDVERAIDRYGRTVLQGVGGLAGTVFGSAAGPAGTVGGGALGYAIGDEIADQLQVWFGFRKQGPVVMELLESAEDISTGLTYEMAGASLGPAAGLIPKIPGVKRSADWIRSFLPKGQKGAEKAAGEVFAAITEQGPLIVKNIEEARALEEAIPGLKFDLGQLTGDVDVIRFAKETGKGPQLAVQTAQKRLDNTKAISDYIDSVKGGKEGVEELKVPLAKQRTRLQEAEEIAQRNLEQETIMRRGLAEPEELGRVIQEEADIGEAAARAQASELFEAVPEQDIIADDIYEGFKKIARLEHPDEDPANVPAILKRVLKRVGKEEKVSTLADEPFEMKPFTERPITSQAVDIFDSGQYTASQARAKADIAGAKIRKLMRAGDEDAMQQLMGESQMWNEAADMIEGTWKGDFAAARESRATAEAARAKEGYEMTLDHIQKLRSDIAEDLRIAKDRNKPLSLRKRLHRAIEVIDEKLSEDVPKVPKVPKGEIIYHQSREKLKGGKPDFDAYYGDKSFKEGILDEPESGFGENLHAIELPKNTKVLEVMEGDPDSIKFMAKAAKLSGQPDDFVKAIERGEPEAVSRAFEDFNAFWNVGDDYSLKPILDDLGYDAAKFWNEFYIPKEVSEQARVLDPKTLKPLQKTTPSQQLQEARKYYKENVVDKYYRGVMKDIMQGEEKIADAIIAGKFFKPGDKGIAIAQDFNRALGDSPAAKAAIKDYIDQSIYATRSDKTGQVTKAGLNRWLKKHKGALKEYGLENEYDSLVKAQAAAEQAGLKSKEFEKSVASRVLNADVNDVVKQAFSGTGSKKEAAKKLLTQIRSGEFVRTGKMRNAALKDVKTGEVYEGRQTHPELWDERAQELAERYDMPISNIIEEFNLERMYEPGFINNQGKFVNRVQAVREMTPIWKETDAGIEGLQNAMIDEILTEIPLEKTEDVVQLLKSKEMASQFRKYDAALKEVFKDSPKKLKAMHNVRKAVKALEYQTGIQSGEEYVRQVGHILAHRHGFTTVSAARIAEKMAKALRGISKEKVNEFINRGILDPEVAFSLAKAARGGSEEKVANALYPALVRMGLWHKGMTKERERNE